MQCYEGSERTHTYCCTVHLLVCGQILIKNNNNTTTMTIMEAPFQQQQRRSNDELEILREYLLSCPGIDSNSEAIKVAISTFDKARAIILSRRECCEEKVIQTREAASPRSSTASTIHSKYVHGKHRMNKNRHASTRIKNMEETSKTVTTVTNESLESECITNCSGGNDYVQKQKSKEEKGTKRQNFSRSIFLKGMRLCIVDLPLILVFIVTVFTTTLSHVYDDFLSPQIDYMKFTDANRTHDLSYYHRACPLGQMSTNNLDDLVIHRDFTSQECKEHMMVHGMSIYQNIIRPETAHELRTYVIQRNKHLKAKDAIGVIANENRWSFGIGANDHPSVSKALNEIATHEMLRPALEEIAGKNPAMIEMTAITAAYGATDQDWHPDIISMGSPAKFVTKFVPSYALFITLQDTTAEMGATEICPGTYMCGNPDAHDTCLDYGFKVSGANNLWKVGDGLLMNQQSFHRGTAHIDPNAPHRVVFIITFSPRPIQRGETRMLGQGGSYSLRWDMWGHTLNDLQHAPKIMVQPWTTLRALGIYKPKDADWGWDLINQHSARAANFDNGYETPEDTMHTIIGFPQLLLVNNDDFSMSAQTFFRACIQQWKNWALYINVIVVMVYFLSFAIIGMTISLVVQKNISRNFFIAFFHTIVRLTTVYIVIAGVVYYTYNQKITNSNWGQEISNGTYLYSPYVVSEKLDDFLHRETMVVKDTDVLVTDRFNIKHLYSLTEVPQYHPGNMQLRSIIKGASGVIQILKPSDMSALASLIVANSLQNDSTFAFLNDNTEWVPFNVDEAEKYVSNALFLERNPLIESLDSESKFLQSFYRYGYRKNSTMARKHSPVSINKLMDKIFEHNGIPIFTLLRSIHATYYIQGSKSTLQLLLRKSSLQLHHSMKSFLQLQSTINKKKPSLRIPLFQKSTANDISSMLLQKGTVVEGKYNGIHNEWYKGKIVNIEQGGIIDVMYADGEMDYYLSPHHIKLFKPYTKGDVLEVNVNGEFRKARVVETLNDGNLNVRLLNNHKQNVSVSEESVRRFY